MLARARRAGAQPGRRDAAQCHPDHDRHLARGPRRRVRLLRGADTVDRRARAQRDALRPGVRDRADHADFPCEPHDGTLSARPWRASQRHAPGPEDPDARRSVLPRGVPDRRIRRRLPARSPLRPDQGLPRLWRRHAARRAWPRRERSSRTGGRGRSARLAVDAPRPALFSVGAPVRASRALRRSVANRAIHDRAIRRGHRRSGSPGGPAARGARRSASRNFDRPGGGSRRGVRRAR